MTVQFEDVERPRRAGVSWGGRAAVRRGAAGAVALLLAPAAVAASLTAGPATEVVAASGTTGEAHSGAVSVIVRERPGAGDAPERALAAVGGSKDRPLTLIDGYSATLPADKVDELAQAPGVFSVSPNAGVQLATESSAMRGTGSMFEIAQHITNADELWRKGITGKGVDVALIDSGVVPVDGLRRPGKVINGEDFSLERFDCTTGSCVDSPAKHLDSYGHGTHMAGIIAGRDNDAEVEFREGEEFRGMAPDARIVNVKVADAWGASDVSQVIAGIDWVVRNRQQHGMNIRVLNLSFGTDGVQNYLLDPLAYAVEQAWHSGIAVVVSAGNAGYGSAKLNNPAYDPYVIAVGAANTKGTSDVSDDVVPSWSSSGDGTRNPDLVAPGASVVSLRDPRSFLDVKFSEAQLGTRFFRGSGTSQAGAVVAGAAALLIQQRPAITPDQLKALLMRSARRLPAADDRAQGSGLLDLERASTLDTPLARQTWPRALGTGSLEAARGTYHITIGGQKLAGETDALKALAAGDTWKSDTWNGHVWNGRYWHNAIWGTSDTGDLVDPALLGRAWSGRAWSGRAWSSAAWKPLPSDPS